VTRQARTVALVFSLALLGSLSLAHGHASPIKSDHTPFESRKVVSQVQAQQKGGDDLWGAFVVDSGYDEVPDTANQTQPAVAFDGTNYLVVWTTSSAVWGTRVDSTGRVIDPLGFLISASAPPSSPPAVAYGQTSYLVIWLEGSQVYGASVTSDGIVHDPGGYVIYDQAVGTLTGIALSFNGVSYLATSSEDYWTYPGPHQYEHYWGIVGIWIDSYGQYIGAPWIGQPSTLMEQVSPAISSDDTNWLVVWLGTNSAAYEIDGQFMDRNASPLGGRRVICDGPGVRADPAIAHGDTGFLIAWEDTREQLDGPLIYPPSLYGARMSRSGLLLDSLGFVLSDSADRQILPRISYDGNNYLVVWQDHRHSRIAIRGRRISRAGSVVDTSTIVLTSSNAGESRVSPCVAYGGSTWLVFWQDARNGVYQIYGARADGNGVVLDTGGFNVGRCRPTFWADDTAAVASDGQDYFVVWPRTTFHDIIGIRVRRGGVILDSEMVNVSTASDGQVNCALAYADTTYLVVWENLSYSKIYGARVTRSGRLLDSLGIPISSGNSRLPSVATDGSNFLVVWQSLRGSPASYYISATRVDESGNVLDPPYVLVPGGPTSQDEPSVTFGAEDYLVSWRESSDGLSRIYGTRVSRTGQVLDTAGIVVSPQVYEAAPSVAFDGTNFLVVWQNKPTGQWADMLGARVNQDGVLIDTTALVVMPAATYYDELRPRVAFDGRNYVVVWTCFSSAINDAYGRRVTPSGGLLDTFCIGTGPCDQVSPSVSANSQGEVLIVYSGYTDSLYRYPLGALRIWGRAGTLEGIQEPSARTNLLYQLRAAPNPFRTAVSFQTMEPYPARIRISDASGRTVRRIEARSSEVVWNGKDESGSDLPPGVYLVQLETERNANCLKVIKLDR